jgi:hypothetical protein
MQGKGKEKEETYHINIHVFILELDTKNEQKLEMQVMNAMNAVPSFVGNPQSLPSS